MANGQDTSGTVSRAYKRSFGLDQYGAGRSLLLKEMEVEKANEQFIFERDLKRAEDAAREQSEGSSLWSTFTGVAMGLGGLFSGGPKAGYEGFMKGREVGKWGHRLLSGYDPKDYAVSTDVGKFGVDQKYKLEDVNRKFVEADKAQFWKDVTGTGMSLLAAYSAPEGLAGSEWWGEGGGSPDWLRTLKEGKQYGYGDYFEETGSMFV